MHSKNRAEILTPQNSVLFLIDFQPQMAFGVANMDRQLLKNNTVGLTKAAHLFQVPTIITAVESQDLVDMFFQNYSIYFLIAMLLNARV